MEFILTNPIKFANKGEEELGYKITGTAPTAKSRNQLIVIKQTFFAAISQMQKAQANQPVQATPQEAPELTGELALVMLYSANVNMEKFHQAMRELFTLGGVLKLEGVPMTTHLLDQMDFDDSERLVGAYLKAFLLKSLVGL